MDALLFIDTNVYLDFYRIRKSDVSLEYLQKLKGIDEIIISTSQVQMEFLKNRQNEISRSISEGINKKSSKPYQVPIIVTDNEVVKEIKKVDKQLKKLEKKLQTDIEKLIHDPENEDKVYQPLLKLFNKDSDYHLAFESEEFEEVRTKALKRWRAGYPPRKMNDTSIGDAINWEWMIKCIQSSNKGLIIVTRDEDYGMRYKKNLHLNDWLKKEFEDRTDGKEILLTNKLSHALKTIDVEVTEEMEKEENVLVRKIDLSNFSEEEKLRAAESLTKMLTPMLELNAKFQDSLIHSNFFSQYNRLQNKLSNLSYPFSNVSNASSEFIKNLEEE